MRTRGAKGHILVHVLITAVIIAIISAGIARMLLTRYAVLNRATQGTQNQRYDTGAINRVISVWAKTGVVCSNASGYTCNPGAPPCTCCPTDTKNDAAIQVLASGQMCVLTPDGNANKSYSGDSVCPSFVCP